MISLQRRFPRFGYKLILSPYRRKTYSAAKKEEGRRCDVGVLYLFMFYRVGSISGAAIKRMIVPRGV